MSERRFSAYEETTNANSEFMNSEVIIAQNCRYSLNDIKSRINNNSLIVGGSGTGKTSTVVAPNIEQAVGSYIVSDPKGNLYKRYRRYLEKRGYDVYNIDFIHPERSTHYNPLNYIHTTQDIISIASTLINEGEDGYTRNDPFWDNMAIILLSSIIGYMVETEYTPFNFSGILRLVREGERADEDSKLSHLSARFKLLDRDSWARNHFTDANQAPYKTYDCIRATLVSKFSTLDTKELQCMMDGNDFTFESIGEKKTAIFVTVSDTDRSMDCLANIFFTQAMQQLCKFADEKHDSRLPVPVRFILDDFATNCRIDEFPRMISSIRSRGISVMLLIQSESQLAKGYGDDKMTIKANCDTYMYLGGNDYSTAESVAMMCNKPVSQILYMPIGSCWVFRRGSKPVFAETLVPGERKIIEKCG
ncbi:MAG: type IV secretory system conjugative DNA transfer family protein [Oscillospiraceae bacterium]|nr:type IV secretory system conjugative DNA transfer family protein [Oscillospiraceae bacterium]